MRVIGLAGTILLGVALAIAPIAAITDRMTWVSGIGIAGIALLIVAYVLRRLTSVKRDDDRNASDVN
ncbi:MAG TPA: hypothetical protein VNE58_18295 [Casimicrobiaceae bacterium]|nr:hypothetical protein [Casimicrobiaceae bacterium]